MPIAINKMKQLTLYFALWLTACTVPTLKERKTTTDSNVLILPDTAIVQADTIALPSDPAVMDNGDFLAYAADPRHIKMF